MPRPAYTVDGGNIQMADNQASEARLGHSKSLVVTREQLAALPVVVGTDSFKPVAHIELVVSLESVLGDRGIKIRSYRYGPGAVKMAENYPMSENGRKMYGTMNLVK